MNNSKAMLGVLGAVVMLGGCSRTDEYAPAADADAESIYQAACVSCHQPTSEGVLFELSADKAKPAAIAEHITKGSIAMPGFPNISGEKLEQLSLYVIANSNVK